MHFPIDIAENSDNTRVRRVNQTRFLYTLTLYNLTRVSPPFDRRVKAFGILLFEFHRYSYAEFSAVRENRKRQSPV